MGEKRGQPEFGVNRVFGATDATANRRMIKSQRAPC